MIKIHLDSNVFRNQSFIDWLILHKESFVSGISIIVYIETLFWYLTKRQTIDDFGLDLADFQATIIPFEEKIAQEAAQNAIDSILPFKHHARDFIIGTTALKEEATLLTYNLRNFTWMSSTQLSTPESLIEQYLEST